MVSRGELVHKPSIGQFVGNSPWPTPVESSATMESLRLGQKTRSVNYAALFPYPLYPEESPLSDLYRILECVIRHLNGDPNETTKGKGQKL